MAPISETKIVLAEGYAWILFEAVLICIHMMVTGMMMGSVRRRFFSKEFYEKNFPQYKQLGKVMKPDAGYPDDGQGRLADKLNDEDWFTFNNYRRAHMNYLEVKLFFSTKSNQIFSLSSGWICCDCAIINIWPFLYTCGIYYWIGLHRWT